MDTRTRPQGGHREVERLISEEWLSEAKVIERVQPDEVVQAARAVERADPEEIIDVAEVVVDVVTSPFNPLAWVKLWIKMWRAWRVRRRQG